jgi:hypothetical protein
VRRDHVAVSTDNPPTDLTSPPLIPPFPHLPCSFHRLSRAASTPRSESSTSLLVSTIPSSNLRPVSAAPCRVTHVCSGSHPAAMSCACAPTRAEPNLAPADRLSALSSPRAFYYYYSSFFLVLVTSSDELSLLSAISTHPFTNRSCTLVNPIVRPHSTNPSSLSLSLTRALNQPLLSLSLSLTRALNQPLLSLSRSRSHVHSTNPSSLSLSLTRALVTTQTRSTLSCTFDTRLTQAIRCRRRGCSSSSA